MKTVIIGQTVELRGRQGFVTSVLGKYEVCVWFFSPPNARDGDSRFCWCEATDLKEKPDITPLRIKDLGTQTSHTKSTDPCIAEGSEK